MYLNTSSIDDIVFKTNLLNKQVMETVERRKQLAKTCPNMASIRPSPTNSGGTFMASRQLAKTAPNMASRQLLRPSPKNDLSTDHFEQLCIKAESDVSNIQLYNVQTGQSPRTLPNKPTSLRILCNKSIGPSSPMWQKTPKINVEQEIRDIKKELKRMNQNMEQMMKILKKR